MLSPAGSFRDMKTREQIITSMCYTYRHDYGLERSNDPDMISSGMTEQERQWLRAVMAQIFDNDIAPHMEFRHG